MTAPQHFLNFSPLPQGHGSFRPGMSQYYERMRASFAIAALVLASVASHAQEWSLPGDREVLGREAQERILAADDYPATSDFRKRVEYIDFRRTANRSRRSW
jgi:hypothetical protein